MWDITGIPLPLSHNFDQILGSLGIHLAAFDTRIHRFKAYFVIKPGLWRQFPAATAQPALREVVGFYLILLHQLPSWAPGA